MRVDRTDAAVAAWDEGEGEVMLRIAFICAFLLLTGCASGGNSDPRPIPAAWTGEVEAVGDHGHAGFSTVTVMPDGGTRANLTLRGGSAGGRHPWHVHPGRCGDSGSVEASAVGRMDAYPPLEPDERGNASGTASLDASLDPEAEYHVDVHQSLDDATVVGCGDLILAT